MTPQPPNAFRDARNGGFFQGIAAIGEVRSICDRRNAKVAAELGVPLYLVQMVVALEDKRYWLHPGCDPIGLVRAATMTVLRRGRLQGASSISEQTAKLGNPRRRRTLLTKVGTIGRGIALSLTRPKEQVLKDYLSSVYFGRQVFGVQAAASKYFSSASSNLTRAQSLFIAERIALPNEFRLARLTNIMNRRLVWDLLAGQGEQLSEVYGGHFGRDVQSQVSELLCSRIKLSRLQTIDPLGQSTRTVNAETVQPSSQPVSS